MGRKKLYTEAERKQRKLQAQQAAREKVKSTKLTGLQRAVANISTPGYLAHRDFGGALRKPDTVPTKEMVKYVKKLAKDYEGIANADLQLGRGYNLDGTKSKRNDAYANMTWGEKINYNMIKKYLKDAKSQMRGGSDTDAYINNAKQELEKAFEMYNKSNGSRSFEGVKVVANGSKVNVIGLGVLEKYRNMVQAAKKLVELAREGNLSSDDEELIADALGVDSLDDASDDDILDLLLDNDGKFLTDNFTKDGPNGTRVWKYGS